MDLRIQAAIEVIQNRISGKLEIADIARQTNVSASHLRHVFKAETGLSLTQYIKVQRMQQAELLLRTTFLSVKEVMHHVGFSSESYFSREFRRMHGLAPGKYRAKASCSMGNCEIGGNLPISNSQVPARRLPEGKGE